MSEVPLTEPMRNLFLNQSLPSLANNYVQNHQEERLALLHHYDDHMAQSVDSGNHGQVVVKIDSNNGSSGDNEIAPLSKNKSETTAQVLSKETESLRRRHKALQDQENRRPTSNSGGRETLFRSSNASFERNAGLLRIKTKSRFMDPHVEQVRRPERAVKSGGVVRKDKGHDKDDKLFNEDIPEEYKRMKFGTMTILQWVSLIIILAALVCTLSIPLLKRQRLWDLPLWKWEVMILVLICGRLVSGWGIRVIVFLIGRSFLLRKRVLYFVYGLRKAVQNCLWLGLVLIAWHCIFDEKVEKETRSKILPHVNKALVCLLVGTLVWLLKTLLVKVFASCFHVSTFFDRIHDSLCSYYVIETLLRKALSEEESADEEEEEEEEKEEKRVMAEIELQKSSEVKKSLKSSGLVSKRQDESIPIDHLHKLNPKNISAWNMKKLMSKIRYGPLFTMDEQILNSDIEDESSMQIRSECQANEAAKKIFNMVAKPDSEFIHLEDLLRFMEEEHAKKIMQLIGATYQCEGIISLPSFKNWVVRAFEERKALTLSLNDTKTAVDELHNMLNFLVAIIIVIIWLFILGVPIAHFLVFFSSQLLLVVFIFGNTCRTVFEAIIFLFVMHPFDVGDRCEVEGVQMRVEEMNILTTVFLRYDDLKIIYPNSVLATKHISNYYRSPHMGDAIHFSIHISTPMEKIAIMKERIIGYIKSKSDHWYPDPTIIIVDVEDMNRLKMALWPKHRMNHQDMGERWARRSLLVEEMIKVFRELKIEYRMLPHDVNVRHMPGLASDRLPSNWTTCAA
ncbi:hypothetical protein L1049_026107 [Liquidambar formosana]|uniref:Mechanosensitive ion channel protein n=1 Tax=Liquidambar formosana TaxID=63359 RepID=A0AAP0R8U8_LIQFO